MTFRWRLTLTYALLLALTLLVAGGASYAGLRHTLYAALDAGLRADAVSTARLEARPDLEPAPQVAASLDAMNRQQPVRVTVFSVTGREVDRGPSRVGFVPRTGATQVGGERVYMLRVGAGWVQASVSDAAVRASLHAFLWQELLGVPPLLLLSLAVGYLLADRALRPVDQVSDLAARIAAHGQPGERVPEAQGADELARLTRTINAMLARLDEQLTHERLFAHASAHELRTPISVIRAATSLALEGERTPDEYRAALAQVNEVSADMGTLTARLLALARSARPAGNGDVNLADVALLVSELHGEDARARGVKVQVTADDAATRGDFDALVMAAGNLLQNALRYTPRGSVVRVQSGVRGGDAHLTVQDAGPGIPEGDVPRLVRPFQRGERTAQNADSSSGAGLGLALVQAVMTAHGGQLHLESAPLSGLRAELRLPPRR
ncbi:sensor histidine kinase [Deinococcus aquiradiocola]|uniref:histidine kinase n=1 Tax=Deinococcus aquiradiocola TaxID=393059 RepID=A0A917PG85_9DEIO|nr:HAMP domain-containing sensor histidine kinase [Deinococcus aquiradiocola]GGJ76524.1 hypothetical protein GCM10008939_20880 [Deinococcus aquiradiocola]